VPIADISAALGHADEAFTFRVYVHRVENGDADARMRSNMEAAFGTTIGGTVLPAVRRTERLGRQ
jgi:hypothetical protein